MSGPLGDSPFGGFSDMMQAMVDPEQRAKMELGATADSYMNRTLTILQMMYYAKELMGEDEMAKLMKPYEAAMKIMGDNMNQAVEKYTKEHGEI